MGRREEYLNMATTPIFNWPTPDDSDLVRDGAAAIRDLGDAIDTTVGEIDVATAKGDLIAFDGTDYTALPVGADGEVLLADSTEPTGLKYGAAGGFVLIASGNLTGSAVDLTSIPTTFRQLSLVINKVRVSTDGNIVFRGNNVTSSNYHCVQFSTLSTTPTVSTANANFGFVPTRTAAGTSATPNTNLTINFTNYTQPVEDGRIVSELKGFGQNNQSYWQLGTLNSSPLTTINIFLSVGTFTTGTYELYGVS